MSTPPLLTSCAPTIERIADHCSATHSLAGRRVMKQELRFVLIALVALSGPTHFAEAAVLRAPGILVDGFGKHVFKQCSTCPDEGSSDGDTKGGDGVGSAETTGTGNGFS